MKSPSAIPHSPNAAGSDVSTALNWTLFPNSAAARLAAFQSEFDPQTAVLHPAVPFGLVAAGLLDFL
jgi:hypothetical protein